MKTNVSMLHYKLVDITKTLAKCGMPFRGYNEKKTSLEIVDLLS